MSGFQSIAELTDARLLSLLDQGDFSFTMRGWEGDVADFFAPTSEAADILAERLSCLDDDSARYLKARKGASGALHELSNLASRWTGAPPVDPGDGTLAHCRGLALALEPDFILLTSIDANPYHGIAGAVCFSSSWDIRMAIGRRIHRIHSRVPGLNEELAGKIDAHLADLSRGQSWTRLNWGISLSSARNQHPLEKTPRLADAARVESAWLRVELQILHKLPATGAILFGIRPHSIPFDDLGSHAAALRRQIATMPPELLDYKGIGANARLLDRWLQPS